MAVRIYSLAKEMKVDSKELVDICTKIGIRGKGSALASLSDEEVVKLRDHLTGARPMDGGRSTTTAPAPERPRERPRTGSKMPVITAPRPSSPLAGFRKSSKEAGDDTSAPSEAATVTASPAATPEPAGSGPLAARMRREEYVPPGGVKGKLPVLDEQRPSRAEPRPAGGSGPRSRPAVKLAPMPEVDPSLYEGGRSDEVPAQKPDLRLPPDALRAGKPGSKPLAAHLRRHEETLETAKRRHERPAPIPADTEEESKARRGKRGRGKSEVKEDAPILGGREQRQLNRRRVPTQTLDDDRPMRRAFRRNKKTGAGTIAPRKEHISLEIPCTVREFSEAAGIPASQILRILMEQGLMMTITAQIPVELTELVASELGIGVELHEAVSLEDQMLGDIVSQEDDESQLIPRPPVVTFLGHVDHGKTSLLDRIIGIDVVSGESGGITQHIRAYSIEKDGRRISFVDTPGHEAFTEMRARGANVTDIAVLVVAADDGVMPQTEEAISHARAAEVPIVVALNKVDLPGMNINRVMQGLSTNELLPSEWGGEVEVVQTSATTGAGVDTLLDTVLTVAELREFKANPNRPALGTCLEAQQESGRGVVAKVIVQNGTLRVGDIVVCGQAYGRVKAMYDTLKVDLRHDEAGPSMPVNITGFDIAPAAGERFYVLDDIAAARSIAESRFANQREATLGVGVEHVTLENLFDRLDGTGDIQTLNIILRADVRGSIEAIQKELGKLEHPEVKVKVLQATVGGITVADVTLADASDAIIMGFNVVPDENARQLAEAKGVQIRRYEVIYKITEDLKAALEGLLKPEEREVDLGRALVQQTFKISRVGTAAGCRVLSGTVARDGRVRVIRDNTIIGEYPIETLRREKDDTKEVREGMECGIRLGGFNDIKAGDVFEVYRIEEIGRSFDD